MAPKKGTKRAQEAKLTAPADKKQKSESKFQPIFDGIQQADGLSETCRQMLLAAIPGSLGTPSDMRHEIQHVFVRMVGEALDEVEGRLRQALDEQSAKFEEVENSKGKLEEAVVQAKETLSKASDVVQSKQSALDDQARILSEAQTALQEKKDAQRKGNIAVDEAGKLKIDLDKAIEAHLKTIVAGEFEGTDANTHYKALEPFFSDLGLDDSLKTAMPLTCVKPRSERGAFDVMVMEQLEKNFSKKASELVQTLDEAAPKKAERDAAVEAAEAQVNDALALHNTAGEELSSAQASLKDANETVNKAHANLNAYEPERLKALEEKDAKATILNAFTTNIKAFFELLRDHEAKPASPSPDHTNMLEEEKVELVSETPSKLEAVSEATKTEALITVGGA